MPAWRVVRCSEYFHVSSVRGDSNPTNVIRIQCRFRIWKGCIATCPVPTGLIEVPQHSLLIADPAQQAQRGNATMTRLMTVLRLFFLVASVLLVTLSSSPAQVVLVVRIGPPPLPVYDQPICPGEGYIWTPGYWAWDPEEEQYFWVPGTWVMAPEPGLLWTPGYWDWDDGYYRWRGGYWARHVGFYGGINYGYGYPGEGFYGGEWHGNVYRYNTAVTNVNTTIIHNTYHTTVTNNYTTVNRVSYNGGNGGSTARPTSAEMAVALEAHRQATPMQMQQQQTARNNREFHASANHGNPPVAATPKPGVFRGPGVVPARSSANANPAAGNARPENRPPAYRNEHPPETNTNRSAPAPNANRPNAQPRPEAQPNSRERPKPNASRPPENNRPAERPQPHENIPPQRQPNNPPPRENPPKNPHERPAQPPSNNPQLHERAPEPKPNHRPQERPPERLAAPPQHPSNSEPRPKTPPPEQHPSHPPEQKHPEQPHPGR